MKPPFHELAGVGIEFFQKSKGLKVLAFTGRERRTTSHSNGKERHLKSLAGKIGAELIRGVSLLSLLSLPMSILIPKRESDLIG